MQGAKIERAVSDRDLAVRTDGEVFERVVATIERNRALMSLVCVGQLADLQLAGKDLAADMESGVVEREGLIAGEKERIVGGFVSSLSCHHRN